ncbi:MAG TPA: hypothetical protein VHR41_13505 [Gemmatimonadales bacterium]|nr:hypothetical protein [Gemmatimonadales bacterium]
MRPRTYLTALLLAVSPLPLHGQAARNGEHEFDFEIGNWKTHISRLERPLSGSTKWTAYDGTSLVRKLWNGRANTVELEVDGPDGRHIQGLSLRLYNPRSGQWSLNYVSSASGTLGVPTVGRFENGRGEFYDQEEFDGRMILVRNVWKDITPGSCRFEQSFSDDGGKTWELNWIATDTRIREEPAPPTNDAPHDFDFEIGTWTVRNSRLLHPLTDSASWIHFDGTSVARKLWNGRGVLLELASNPPSGHSEGLILRTYNPQARQWNVSFAGSGGGVMTPPAIGGFRGGRGEFYDMEQLDDGRTVLARSVLSDITPTSYRLEQAYSADGGKTWQVAWTSQHTRVHR